MLQSFVPKVLLPMQRRIIMWWDCMEEEEYWSCVHWSIYAKNCSRWYCNYRELSSRGNAVSIVKQRNLYIGTWSRISCRKEFFRRCIWPTYRRFILRNASCVIANSHYTETLVKHCSPNAKTIAIPLAVDAIHFRPTCEKYKDGLLHLCSISRLENLKDMILLSGR